MDAETKKNPPLVCLGPKGYEKHYYPDPEKRIKTDAATIRYNVSTLLKRAGVVLSRAGSMAHVLQPQGTGSASKELGNLARGIDELMEAVSVVASNFEHDGDAEELEAQQLEARGKS